MERLPGGRVLQPGLPGPIPEVILNAPKWHFCMESNSDKPQIWVGWRRNQTRLFLVASARPALHRKKKIFCHLFPLTSPCITFFLCLSVFISLFVQLCCLSLFVSQKVTCLYNYVRYMVIESIHRFVSFASKFHCKRPQGQEALGRTSSSVDALLKAGSVLNRKCHDVK